MSTVLRPAGPEPAETYWWRRVAVVGVVIVVLAVAGALIANGTSSGSAVQTNPAPPPAAASATVASPTSSGSSTARSSASPKATARPTAKAGASTPSSPRASTAAPTRTPLPRPVTCAASTLRPTLTGAQQLKVKQRATFTLSLINGSGQTCAASVNSDNFELRIYSGSDRIWSTKDCAKIVKPLTKPLEAEQALEWKLTWNGLRSRAGCEDRPEIPRPGTYYATAQLTGAEPVQLLLTLRG